MKKKALLFFSSLSLLVVLLSLRGTRDDQIGAVQATAGFERNARLFAVSLAHLDSLVRSLPGDSASLFKIRAALAESRLRYKTIAFFSAYFFPSETAMYNAAPKYEVEEPELELFEPMGLQQIESLLFEKDPLANREDLLVQIEALYGSVQDLPSLLYQFKATDPQILESLRIELVRIITLYISGYDAPLLKTGITEALQASLAIRETLKPYLVEEGQEEQALSQSLDNSISYLRAHQNFDAFDRMEYLRKYALPLQAQLNTLIDSRNLQLNTTPYLNYKVPNLFSRGFLKRWDSIPPARKASLLEEGEKLFFDTSLSGNSRVSCSTCHQPGHFFSDGKMVSPALVPDSALKRNTPTLLYAGRQHLQFWDGRAGNLVQQIKTVIFNPLEMGGDSARLSGRINEIALSISAYVANLEPLNAPFDRYLAGEDKAMTAEQVKGFNLFMGKAQCGTCHFPPYFNGLVPPLYDRSELEILGTPKTEDLQHPLSDDDLGRFDLYKIRYYRQAFKTPTVRNSEKTAPYMHNGAFRSLDSLMEFYNRGGGRGIGLQVEEQSLSAVPLNLSAAESKQIIQFINSLTDTH